MSTDTELFASLCVMAILVAVLGITVSRGRQPPVVGEILAGVALGPCLLGLLPGHPLDHLFTGAVRSVLDGLGQVGLVCYLFGVGRELDMGMLRRHRGTTGAVAAAASLTPLAAGLLVAPLVGPWTPNANRSSLAPALAVALSVTAVPVLARTISERGMANSREATISLAAAAIGDAASWILLAIVIAVYRPSTSGWVGLPLVGLTIVSIAAVLVGRPLLRLAMTSERSAAWPLASRVAIVGSVLFAISAGTSLAGLHSVFGALICGIVCPRSEKAAIPTILPRADRGTGLKRTTESGSVQHALTATGTLLLPAFFVSSGLQMQRPSGSVVEILALIVTLTAVASVAKVFPSTLAARLAVSV